MGIATVKNCAIYAAGRESKKTIPALVGATLRGDPLRDGTKGRVKEKITSTLSLPLPPQVGGDYKVKARPQ